MRNLPRSTDRQDRTRCMPDRAQGCRSQDHTLEEAPAGRTQHNEVAFLRGCERVDLLGWVSVPHQLADAAALALFGGNPVANVRRGLVRTAFTYIEGRDDRAEAGAQAGGQAEGVAGYVRAVDRAQNPANRLPAGAPGPGATGRA